MAFWRSVRDWIVGLLFGALLLGTIGAPSAQLYFALQTLKSLNAVPSLRSPPLGDAIWNSVRLSRVGAIIGITGAALFWISIIVAGPERGNARSRRQKACEHGSLPIGGCVCLAATVIDLVSIRTKQKFLPLLGDDCYATPEWPVNIDGRRSFWTVADAWYAAQSGITLDETVVGNGQARPYSAELAGFHFLVEYRVQIVATAFLFFLGLGLVGTVMLDLSDRFQRRSILSRIGYTISTWLGVICILTVAGPIFLIFEFFDKVAPWTRYHRAYAVKVCERPLGRLRPVMHRLREGLFAVVSRPRYGRTLAVYGRSFQRQATDIELGLNKQTSTTSPIMAICRYDLAVLLSQQMHYTDVVTLSQTCRAWHECIFPPDRELREQQDRFKSYSCCAAPCSVKWECWSCTRTICLDCCDRHTKVDQDFTSGHLFRCAPYCRGCFRTLTKGRIRRADCRRSSNRKGAVSICGPCRRDTREPLLWKGSRKWRYKVRQRDVLIDACGKCSQPLEATGARFWVCRKAECEHECRSSAHLSWVTPGEEQGKDATVTVAADTEDKGERSATRPEDLADG